MTDAKTIVITGASDGIGAAAARDLSARGHHVVVVGRSADKTHAIAAELGADCVVADFSRLADVRRLAEELDDRYARIDVLANNAGGVFGNPAKTTDGFEPTFQVNQLAPFLLTQLLMHKLVASHASIIQTSSTLRFSRHLDLDDLNHDKHFSGQRAYTASKLENVLFTSELHRRFHHQHVSAVSLYPGNVASNFAATSDVAHMRFIATNPVTRRMLLSPEKGADTLVWLADSTPETDWVPGSYYYKRKPVKPGNAQARDGGLARRFWDTCEQLLA